jgi:hypothetical protein
MTIGLDSVLDEPIGASCVWDPVAPAYWMTEVK